MADSKSFCGCKGGCGNGFGREMDRRDFLKTTAAGGLGLAVAGTATQAQGAYANEVAAVTAWKQSVRDKGSRRVYQGSELARIAFPLGGIGGGQLYLRGNGSFGQWEMVNNFNANATVPGAFFGVRAYTPGAGAHARVLQEGKRGEMEGVASVEFSGEYPFAWLTYRDEALPVDVSLEAFTNFIPLNAKDSALPAALFRFTFRNRTGEDAEVSLLASATNLTGWDGYGVIQGVEWFDFLGNANSMAKGDRLASLTMQAREGRMQSMDRPIELLTNYDDAAFHMRHCEGVTKRLGATFPKAKKPTETVYWINPPLAKQEDWADILETVKAGAGLVITDPDAHLLRLAQSSRRQGHFAKPHVFENWSSGTYKNWTIEGSCFGDAPATGPSGACLVDTHAVGGGLTGRAASKPFKIRRDYIHVQIGGGNKPEAACVNVVVDDKIVASATGNGSETLHYVALDLFRHRGKTAHIEIVDAASDSGGHILVGEICFSDNPVPADAAGSLDALNQLYEALPMTWRDVRRPRGPMRVASDSVWMKRMYSADARADDAVVLQEFRKKRGARVLLKSDDGRPLVIAGEHGQGRIVACLGRPNMWMTGADRKIMIGLLLAEAAQAVYAPDEGIPKNSPLYGTMALGVIGEEAERVTACPQWDDAAALWDEFARTGRLDAFPSPRHASEAGRTWNGALCTPVSLAPGESRTVTLALAWHFPNRMRTTQYGWGPSVPFSDHRLGNRYREWFASADEALGYVAANMERLARETALFHDTLYETTLPHYLLDAVSANIGTIGSPVYMWLEDGTWAGFEGAACCPMNCTHVFNYAMSCAFLFPELERNVREIDLLVQMHPAEHYIPHRTVLPLSLPRLGFTIGGPEHAALDGELGAVLKTYREFRHQGNYDWLENLWPRTRQLMEYMMRVHDDQSDGVIRGEQPNTYDTHLYGSNTFIGTLYLASLRAASEMASRMGDATFAKECMDRFELGRANYDRLCWNGEYFINNFDMPGAPLDQYDQGSCYGYGCHADQLLGQWWAYALGLGYMLPPGHVRTALHSIYQHNWRTHFRDIVQAPRRFADDDEKGLLNCSWPNGQRLNRPILYGDEVWTGIEYEVAAMLLQEGMIDEALHIVRGVRDRYVGDRRNPYAEEECSYHYTRAMSSYTLLTAAAGLDYSAVEGRLAFAPRIDAEDFRCFFTSAEGWGLVSQTRENAVQRNKIVMRYGAMTLRQACVDILVSHGERPTTKVTLDGRDIEHRAVFQRERCAITFAESVIMKAGQEMEVVFEAPHRA